MENEHLPELEDGPAESPLTTPTGRVLDLNNISGETRLQLLRNGELKVDSLVQLANIPGDKAAILRERAKEGLLRDLKAEGIKADSLVTYKEMTYKVLEVVETEKGTKVKFIKEGKKVSVPITAVTLKMEI